MDRRTFLRRGTLALAAAGLSPSMRAFAETRRPRPTGAQLAWQRDELALFIHFGINTFTNREWGDGREDPAIFAPARLDARQWARAAKAGGFRAMVLTAKHHDGFCLWPTRTTRHGVVSSPWRGGQGDLVREFVDACRAEGLRPGLYLSPWDRNNPTYGDSPRYNDLYCDQLTELLTNYGRLAEVWFDGANGEGPNGKKQVYDWPRVWALVRRLQPQAVMFSDAGPDVRWCGNENGSAGDPNWSTVDPAVVPYPGISGPGIIEALQHGHPNGTVWRPAEADTSIRPGWFYHPAEDARVKSIETLTQLYVRSVGRNSKLLLNVPPTTDGVLHDTDVARLAGCHDRLRAMFGHDLAAGRRMQWQRGEHFTATAEVDLGRMATPAWIRIEEDIERGQSIARYVIEGSATPQADDWRVLARGTTVGYAKIDRVTGDARRIRVKIEDAISEPARVGIRVYSA
jgi:alpha-L-fucosidase